MIHLVDLPSLRSLNAVMHSGETETLWSAVSGGRVDWAAVEAVTENEERHTQIGPNRHVSV